MRYSVVGGYEDIGERCGGPRMYRIVQIHPGMEWFDQGYRWQVTRDDRQIGIFKEFMSAKGFIATYKQALEKSNNAKKG